MKESEVIVGETGMELDTTPRGSAVTYLTQENVLIESITSSAREIRGAVRGRLNSGRVWTMDPS